MIPLQKTKASTTHQYASESAFPVESSVHLFYLSLFRYNIRPQAGPLYLLAIAAEEAGVGMLLVK